jgi:hypothetical protein
LSAETTYVFNVSAYDDNGLEGAPATLSLTTPAYAAPTITAWSNNRTHDAALTLTINESECVSFNASADQPVDTWHWLVNIVDQAHNFDTFTFCGWAVNGTYAVAVNATNANGTSATLSWTVTVHDITPPTQVTGLSNGTPAHTSVDLWWAPNLAPDLAGYKVYQNGGLLDTTTSSSYNVTGLSAETTYVFNVSAYDDNGLEGAPATLSLTTPAYAAPTITAWSNNRTHDAALTLTINESECVSFNASADQPVDTWHWLVNGVDQLNNAEEFMYCWTEANEHSVAVNGTNANGTTNILTWTVRVIPEEAAAPAVTNPSAEPYIIPEDTDNEPLWGELADLSLIVTGASELTSVTINLSSLGGDAAHPMTQLGASDVWAVSTNASLGTAGWNGSAYVPYLLLVTATDAHAQSNTSVHIELVVMKNGDVDESGNVNLDDAIHLANYALLVPGFELVPEIAEVDGSSNIDLEDAIYLANHVLDVPGYQTLR